MTVIPNNHIDDAQLLNADGYVHLFELYLFSGAIVFLKTDKSATWQGNLYEGIGLKMSGEGAYADQQTSRPKIVFQNPAGGFSSFVDEGQLDQATVVRKRVLYDDFVNDRGVCISQQWVVGRIPALSRNYLTVELRQPLDAPNFLIPARTFAPPVFPTVSVRR